MKKLIHFAALLALVGCAPVRAGSAVDACKADPSKPNCQDLRNSVSPAEARERAVRGMQTFSHSLAPDKRQAPSAYEIPPAQRYCSQTSLQCYRTTDIGCSESFPCADPHSICIVKNAGDVIGVCAEQE